MQPEKLKDEEFLNRLRDYHADVFVIASYGKILPQALLDIPLHGTINVHPSLLPRYRGPSPIQSVILNGDKKTGVTLMLTDEKMDHGSILAQQEWESPISNIKFPTLYNELASLGGAMLVETLPKWIAREITPKEQSHEQATFTKLFIKEDGHIDWSKSALEIDRMVRALNPWPGTWSLSEAKPPTFGGFASESKRVKILAGYPSDEAALGPPGTLFETKSGQLGAASGDGTYVITKLQVEGKKEINGETFLMQGIPGDIMGIILS